MNLEQLRGFSEVALTGHFTRAAERLHLAQPSLSRQIATLESDLGVELFHRARGNVTLTAAGERLLPIAKRMLADAEAARGEMAELAGLRRGRIRLGATPTLCTSLVVEVLVEFRERYPGVDVEILERGSRSLIEALLEGTLDLALIVTSVGSGAARAVLEREAVLSERLVLVSSAASPSPVRGTTATLEEVAALPQVGFPENYDLHASMTAAFRAAELEPSTAVSGAEMDASLRFVERGLGVAVVPAMVAIERPGLRAIPLAGAEFSRTISLARRADMAPTHAAGAMQRMIEEVAVSITAPGAPAAPFVALEARGRG